MGSLFFALKLLRAFLFFFRFATSVVEIVFSSIEIFHRKKKTIANRIRMKACPFPVPSVEHLFSLFLFCPLCLLYSKLHIIYVLTYIFQLKPLLLISNVILSLSLIGVQFYISQINHFSLKMKFQSRAIVKYIKKCNITTLSRNFNTVHSQLLVKRRKY